MRDKVTGECLLDSFEKALPLTLYVFKQLSLKGLSFFLDVVKCKLSGFQWSLDLISSAVDTLQRLCRASAETPVEEQVCCKLSWICLPVYCTQT